MAASMGARSWGSGPSHSYDLSEVVCLVGMTNPQFRGVLRSAFVDQGIRQVEDAGTTHALREKILEIEPDLMLVDYDLPGESVPSMVEGIRHGEVGHNPFMIITGLTTGTQPEPIHALIQAGVDDLVTMPVPPVQVVKRTLTMVEQRKQFVVTGNYTGPDRRTPERNKKEPPAPGVLFEVPNTLKMKAEKTYDPNQVKQAIHAARSKTNSRKAEHHASSLVAQARELLPVLHRGKIDTDMRRRLKKLGILANDMDNRVTNTHYDHVSELCGALGAVTQRLEGAPEPDPKDVQLFEKVVQAVERAFSMDESEGDVARAITETIRESRRR